jgi:hypothetical protein
MWHPSGWDRSVWYIPSEGNVLTALRIVNANLLALGPGVGPVSSQGGVARMKTERCQVPESS